MTVPVLYDKKTNKIVNNESSEIMRMLNTAFDEVGAIPGDFYPEHLRDEIDEMNELVYHKINNGVYKAGFATEQAVYDEEVQSLFNALDELESLLANKKYLIGDTLTEADWRLFVTLVRFDTVYYGHFKCNIRELREYQIYGATQESSIIIRELKRQLIFIILNIIIMKVIQRLIQQVSYQKGQNWTGVYKKSQTRGLSCQTF